MALVKREMSETRNPFADRSSRVPRLLFREGPGTEWTVTSLAEATGLAVSTVSYVIRALEKRRIVTVRPEWRERRIRLEDPEALIREWSRTYDYRDNPALPVQAPVGSPRRFLRRLPSLLSGHRWALTLHAGASLIAPHASWDRVHAYVDAATVSDLRAVARALDWAPDETGALVLLAPRYRTSVWWDAGLRKRLPVASRLQLILDLWRHPLRGREQAEELLPSWMDRGDARRP